MNDQVLVANDDGEAAKDAPPDIELVEEPYQFVEAPVQKLRCFIIEHMASPDIDGKILLLNMQAILEWVLDGTMPTPPKPTKPVRAAS